MLDNLRRSLLAPLHLLALGLCWLLPPAASLTGTLLLIGCHGHSRVPACGAVHAAPSAGRRCAAICACSAPISGSRAHRLFLSVALLPDQAWRMTDAIGRTLFRLFVSRRHLLEWTTAAQAGSRPRLDLLGFQREMIGGTSLTVAVSAGAIALAPASWPVILPFTLLWLASPALALWASRARAVPRQLAVSEADAVALRLVARRTWRFFETFVTPSDGMLPPDNFQEEPRPVVAHRTSPTNIGLYLLATVAARDFGWAGTSGTVERLETTIDAMRKLARFKGHFFNWYGTQDLQVLAPAYVSSVDSGNLAGHLIAMANACEEWRCDFAAPNARTGIADQVRLAREAVGTLAPEGTERVKRLVSILDDMEDLSSGPQGTDSMWPTLTRLAEKAVRAAHELVPAAAEDSVHELVFWTEALVRSVADHGRDRIESDDPQALAGRLQALAVAAREMALAMDFAFLLDPERKLLSIGYNVADNRMDPSCYDLLASEARLASLIAIATGDVPSRHWLRLGRTATPLGTGSALVSWSGSMFEYLMPSLVMRAPAGSLLEQTNRLVVDRQMAYGRSLGIPWGISESAYNARDIEFTYQYSNFGVPGLGLKRGLGDNLVIAPYATGLAAMVDPNAARQNFSELAQVGANGRYGFYEALDYTRSRLPDGQEVAIVRNYMAHHQGMTIVAIANALHEGLMRERFHREPMIQACELLLQERMPRDVALAHPRAEEVKGRAPDAGAVVPSTRRRVVPGEGAPVTHLLSNGRYAVMLTTAGAGYSRWRDLAITRWQEDVTCDDWGSFVFLRDTRTGKYWSAGSRPVGARASYQECMFDEDRAEMVRHDGSLTTTLDVLVSGEDDGEVRRVTVSNGGRRPCEIELTSYAEIVLTTVAADQAHPAFAKLFVVTEYLPEFGALLATRRPRSHDELTVWAAHFAVVEGEVVADPQYESDRARFIGRSRSAATSDAIVQGRALSNTVGTVLDPIFSIRQRLAIPEGGLCRVAFWTVVASSRAELLDLLDKHHDRSAFDRAKTLAWTQAQVQLRYLDVGAAEASDFQQLAAPILYADPRFRASSEAIARGCGRQSGLWPHAISGDLPIVLLHIDDLEDMGQLRQLLRAHEYWRMKRLAVDLVIVNDRAASYVQDLQIAIETAVRSSRTRERSDVEPAHGAIHVLRADLVDAGTRALLKSVARVSLTARNGSIAAQLDRLRRQPADVPPPAGQARQAQPQAAAPVAPGHHHRARRPGVLQWPGWLRCRRTRVRHHSRGRSARRRRRGST